MKTVIFKALSFVADWAYEKYRERKQRKADEARAKFEAEIDAIEVLEASRAAQRKAQQQAEEAARIRGAAEKEMEHRP